MKNLFKLILCFMLFGMLNVKAEPFYVNYGTNVAPTSMENQTELTRKMLYGFFNGKFTTPVTFIQITNAPGSTNLVVNAPIWPVMTITNAGDGLRTPTIVAYMLKCKDGFPIDAEFQPFRIQPTNTTYTAGSAITTFGNDETYRLWGLSTYYVTNAAKGAWRTNGGVATLETLNASFPLPISGTNCSFLFISKSTGTLTNGIELWLGIQ